LDTVAQIATPQTGTIRFYKGLTLGYRALHLYLPRQGAVTLHAADRI
jgi:hypothetical protein